MVPTCSHDVATSNLRDFKITETVIRSRIDADMKNEASRLFKKMGLTLSEAIRLFVYQSVAEKRIPFAINIPNPETQKVLAEARDLTGLEKTGLDQLTSGWKKACAKQFKRISLKRI